MKIFSFFMRKHLLFSILLICLFNSLAIAQTPTSPADCKTGCTSGDVQIQRAYLSDIGGNELPQNFVCPASGMANVYLTLELTTKTPRVGVVIYSKVKNFIPPSTIGSEIRIISQCFGTDLNQPANKVTFTDPFNWTCGNPIVLTDVFIGWGTGNSNFCTGSTFQCPATSSKCYSLPPGQYIPIQTPTANPTSASECSTTPGGTTAVFNLTALESTVKGSQTNVTVTWYSDAALTNQIATTTATAYSSATATVYAKVSNNTTPSVYSTSMVTLTVKTTPAAPTLGKVDNCNGISTITATGMVSGATLAWSDGGSGNPRTVSATTALTVTQTVNGCPSSSSNSVTPAPKTTPTFTVCLVQPTLCAASGSVTFNASGGTGLEYSINNGTSYSTNNVFSNLGTGAVTGYKVKNAAGCESASTCASTDPSCTPAPVTSSNAAIQEQGIITQHITMPGDEPTIKAFPNPYNDRIRFVVSVPERGQGSLEVHNMLGQKVKTVYQGLFAAGTQSFEMQVPNSQQSTLIYVLRLNGKQVSGKMLQAPE